MASLDGDTVPGTFSYSPRFGTVLGPGNNQSLSVLFAPSTADHTSVTGAVSITNNTGGITLEGKNMVSTGRTRSQVHSPSRTRPEGWAGSREPAPPARSTFPASTDATSHPADGPAWGGVIRAGADPVHRLRGPLGNCRLTP